MICSDVGLNELCAWTARDTRQRNTLLSSKLSGTPREASDWPPGCRIRLLISAQSGGRCFIAADCDSDGRVCGCGLGSGGPTSWGLNTCTWRRTAFFSLTRPPASSSSITSPVKRKEVNDEFFSPQKRVHHLSAKIFWAQPQVRALE